MDAQVVNQLILPVADLVLNTVTVVVLPILSTLVVRYLKKKHDITIAEGTQRRIEDLARQSVMYASQALKNQDNPEKLKAAKLALIENAKAEGLKLGEKAAEMAVEAMVNRLKRERGAITD